MIRRLLLLMALATGTAAFIAPTASAGLYSVRACWDGDGINHTWRQDAYDAGVSAYTQCPAGPTYGSGNAGMTARNSIGASVAPGLDWARVAFQAPAGARIVRIWGDVNLLSQAGWQAGIIDDDANAWKYCGTGCTSTFGWRPFDLAFSTTRVAALVICGLGQGCSRSQLNGAVALRNVNVVLQENGAPSVAITGGALVSGGWHRGVQYVNVTASDPIGISTIRAMVDGSTARREDSACDFTFAIPCPTRNLPIRIDTAASSDGPHSLTVEASDSAGNPRRANRTIYTDNHPPTRPANLTVDGGFGWRARNQFTLRWQNPRQTAAPISSAHVELCRPSDNGACPEVVGTRTGISAVTVSVPGSGEWRARVRLADSAGNLGTENYAEAVLRLDEEAPSLFLQTPSPARPAVVKARATDRSGLATREILVRRRGAATWGSLPVKIERDGFSAVIDDEALPDGVYEVRARAVDLAGNERSTDRRADGKPLLLALPVRIRTRLTVGRPTRVRAQGAHGRRRYRIKLTRSPRTRFGRAIPLRGRLTSPGGNPLADREVQVFEQTQVPGATWRAIATLQTNARGRFTFRALRGPSRTLRFRYQGSDTIRGRTAEVRLGVRAATSMRASRTRVVNGEEVTFRGRLRGGPRPATGKLLEIQALTRGGWRTFATARANPRTGRWSYRYRFSATRGDVRYRFRARIPKESGYPYETGVSRAIAVRVRGL